MKLLSLGRYLLYFLPLVFFAGIFIQDINPSGVKEIDYDVQHDSPEVSRLFPANRLAGSDAAGQKILAEPVYFKVRYPRNYQQAIVTLDYSNQGQSLVQLGLQINGEDEWQYAFRPIENNSFDNLNWSKLVSGNTTLWQKQNKFASVNDFLENYYPLQVGAYNFDLLKRYHQENYLPSQASTTIDRLIRGQWSLYTYIKNESLDFTIKTVDFNRTVGPDPILLTIKNWQGQEVYNTVIADDGRVGDRVGASPERTVRVRVPDLPEGVYRFNWEANNDIFVTSIATSQHLLAFIDRLYLANNKEYRDGLPNLAIDPTTIYTTARSFGISTAHPSGLQTIQAGDQQLSLIKIHEQAFGVNSQGLATLQTPANDVMIQGDGLFFFRPDQVFNPEVIKLKNYDPGSNLDYIIADYRSPLIDAQGHRHTSTTFDLAPAQIQDRTIRFIISAPNYNEQGNELVLHKIHITLYKPPLINWQQIGATLLHDITNAWEKL